MTENVEDSSVCVNSSRTERDGLIAQYQGFAEQVAQRLSRYLKIPLRYREEILAAGMYGLVEAAERYDPDAGREFRGFAFMRIRGAIIDFIRDSCELSGAAYRKVKALRAALDYQEEQCTRLESRPPIQHSFEHIFNVGAVAALAYRLQVDDLSDTLSDDRDDAQQAIERKEMTHKLRTLVRTLPDKERAIVEAHYFEDRPFCELVDLDAGLSKSWVSRLHSRAIDRLRRSLLEQGMSAHE